MTRPTDDVGKKKYNKNDINVMRITMEYIKDNLIPYISKLDTSKNMYDSPTRLYTINNIGQITSLINELCYIRMTKNNTLD